MDDTDSDTDSDGVLKTKDEAESDDTNNDTETVQIELEACDLSVKVKADNEDFETVFNQCSRELESIMHHHLVGEMEMIEKEDMFPIILG